MLELATPLWLLALPLAVAPLLTRHPRAAFSSLSLLKTGSSLRVRLAWLPALFAAAGIALLVLSLARPQLVDRELIVEREGIDIMLVLDVSGSMEIADYVFSGREVSRLAVAREVIADFVEARPEDRVGLVIFGEEAVPSVPLTLDQRGMAAYTRQLQIGMAGARATVIGDAIAIGAQRLDALDAPSRIMILVSDGANHGGQITPMAAADAAAALGIRIYTVGIGTANGGRGVFGRLMGRGSNDLDEETLRAIASTSGGEYFYAEDTRALRQVYATIDQLEKTTAEVSEYVHLEERYHLPAALGMVALLLSLLLSETWLRRLP
ncbi:MAG: Ca-activated chloride channel family protein [Myxococcota bacterium]|jgi:Ca-activated chloride channel family protein